MWSKWDKYNVPVIINGKTNKAKLKNYLDNNIKSQYRRSEINTVSPSDEIKYNGKII